MIFKELFGIIKTDEINIKYYQRDGRRILLSIDTTFTTRDIDSRYLEAKVIGINEPVNKGLNVIIEETKIYECQRLKEENEVEKLVLKKAQESISLREKEIDMLIHDIMSYRRVL